MNALTVPTIDWQGPHGLSAVTSKVFVSGALRGQRTAPETMLMSIEITAPFAGPGMAILRWMAGIAVLRVGRLTPPPPPEKATCSPVPMML